MFKFIDDLFDLFTLTIAYVLIFLMIAIPLIFAYQYYPLITLWGVGIITTVLLIGLLLELIERLLNIKLDQFASYHQSNHEHKAEQPSLSLVKQHFLQGLRKGIGKPTNS